MSKSCSLAVLLAIVTVPGLIAQDDVADGAKQESGKIVFRTDFQKADENWQMSDPAAWRFAPGGTLSLFRKKSGYEPPFRSPRHIALLRERRVSDFVLDVRVLSTHEDYNHRDVCLFFGYQSPSQFYYAHLGKQTDPHANQIFIVNNAARTKISRTTSEGTPWDADWHHVRIERDTGTGDIRVFFDDMTTPAMTARDSTFQWGNIGLGSFDDTADFDDLVLRGKLKK